MVKTLGYALVAGIILAATAPAASAADARSGEWPLDARHLRADQVWAASRGHGVTVAVLDTGCQGDHPDLAGQLLPGTGFAGVTGDTGQSDVSGDSHGTSIAAIIAGTGKNESGTGMIGLAPEAKILPVRVAVDGATEPVALAQGIFYATDHGAKIITISESTTTPDPNLRAAITHALNHNVVVVAAVGNNGQRGNPPGYPAYFPGVVAVTGVDANNQFWPQSQSGPQTTLAAPATNIVSANDHGGYLHGDGTSYAAPYVAATAALIASKYPTLTAGQIIRQMIDTADRHNDAQHDDQYGFGILNPLRALTSPATTASGIPTLAPPSDGPNWWLIIGGAALLTAASAGWLAYRRVRAKGSTS